MTNHGKWLEGAIPFGVFLALLGTYHLIFGAYFPLPNGLMGSDYSLTLAGLLDGYLWFRNNGILEVPWFSPSFCAGQPFFADPQSIFYSLPQFLAFITDPLTAAYSAILAFAALGFWGMYLLSRNVFGLSALAALAAATAFMFNGFYAHRMIVGHYGYQPFMLIPWLAWLLCRQTKTPRLFSPETGLYTIGAGLVLAYWLQGGLTTLIVPCGLSVLALAALAQLRSPVPIVTQVLLRGTGATLLSLALCASKLVASLTLMGNFARTYYSLPGISDPAGLVHFAFHALFYSSEHAYRTVTPLWQNMQWAAMPHELAFGITFIPLFVMLAGVAFAVRDRTSRPSAHKWVAWSLLVVLTVIPLALLYYSPEWNAVLKRLPLIGSTTSPNRWLCLYIAPLCLLTGIAADAPRMRRFAAAACILGIPALNALEVRDYYQQQSYDPQAILSYYRSIENGGIDPKITHIGLSVDAADRVLIDNTLFTKGYSPLFCYNPLFGYRQENYQIGHLQPGPVTSTPIPGGFNIRNPACMVYPVENGCRIWDGFKSDQLREVERFTSYRPFEFRVSPLQRAANLLTELALLLTAIALPTLFFIHRKRQHAQT